MPKVSSLSLVFPAYNDAGTIASMVVAAVATARTLTDDFEVVVVNDCSRDHTGSILAELERLYPRELRVVTHAANRGYGGAIRSGFAHASKEWIFYTDGDAQYDPREVANLVGALAPGVHMVNGYKITRHDPFHRVIIGEIYRVGVKFLFGLKIRDVDCDFRLMHRTIFDRIELVSTSGTITLELARKIQVAGFVIREVPVHHYFRAYGSSQFFNLRRVGRTLVDLTRWWWRLVGKPALEGRRGGVAIAPATPPTHSSVSEPAASRTSTPTPTPRS